MDKEKTHAAEAMLKDTVNYPFVGRLCLRWPVRAAQSPLRQMRETRSSIIRVPRTAKIDIDLDQCLAWQTD
jgi:hypothetical protein